MSTGEGREGRRDMSDSVSWGGRGRCELVSWEGKPERDVRQICQLRGGDMLAKYFLILASYKEIFLLKYFLTLASCFTQAVPVRGEDMSARATAAGLVMKIGWVVVHLSQLWEGNGDGRHTERWVSYLTGGRGGGVQTDVGH